MFPLHSEWPEHDSSQETLWFPACLALHGNLRGLAPKLPERKTSQDGWEWRALGRAGFGWVSVPGCTLADLFPSTPDASEQELPVTALAASFPSNISCQSSLPPKDAAISSSSLFPVRTQGRRDTLLQASRAENKCGRRWFFSQQNGERRRSVFIWICHLYVNPGNKE